MKSKGIVLVFVLLMILTSAVADIHAAKQPVVGATIWNMAIPFYANFIKGLNDGAAKYGLKLLLRDGQNDPSKLVDVIKQFIAEKVDAIVVVPADPQAVVPVLKEANAANIPVFAANNKAGDGAKVVTFIGADDVSFGRQQAKLLIQAIGKSGNVGYLMGALGTSAQQMRKQGFDAYLKNYPDIKIVSAVSEDWDAAKALAATQDILSRNPKGTLQAIVCQGPEGVSGAQYSHDNGRAEVKIILGDYPANVKAAIQSGIVYGTIDQDPYPQAYQAMHMAKLYLTGKKAQIPTPNYYLDLPIVTQKNVAKFNAAW